MGTGCSMDSCIGLVIHEKGEDWRIYKTVWEDAVAQAAELEFAEVTSEKRGDLDELLKKHIEELNQEIDQAAEEAARELGKADIGTGSRNAGNGGSGSRGSGSRNAGR